MIPAENVRPVAVAWTEPRTDPDNWYASDGYTPDVPCQVLTLGWLVDSKAGILVIATGLADWYPSPKCERYQARGLVEIPESLILRISYLAAVEPVDTAAPATAAPATEAKDPVDDPDPDPEEYP